MQSLDDAICAYEATIKIHQNYVDAGYCKSIEEKEANLKCIEDYKQLVNWLNELKTLREDRYESVWTPVKESLPKNTNTYLLYGKICEDDEENYIFIGEYDADCEQFGYRRDYYDYVTLGFVDTEYIEYYSVIAWHPMPAEYEESENEKD